MNGLATASESGPERGGARSSDPPQRSCSTRTMTGMPDDSEPPVAGSLLRGRSPVRIVTAIILFVVAFAVAYMTSYLVLVD